MNRGWLVGILWRLASAARRAALHVKERPWLIAVVVIPIIAAAGIILAGFFVLTLFLTKVLWAWTIPDLFPAAVEQGLVADSISWFTALKIVLCLIFIAAVVGSAVGRRSGD